MKTLWRRLAWLGAAAGIALVASSLLTPYTGTFGYFSMNQPTLYFLLPVSTTMTMTSFNGSAQLVISPVGPGLSSLSPIVNITVVPKETVTFNVPVRGFYQIALDRPPGATQSAAISLIQTGVPGRSFHRRGCPHRAGRFCGSLG